MKKILMLTLTALPLVACVGAIDEDGNADAADASGEVGSTQQPLLVSDYLIDFDQVFTNPAFPALGGTPVANGAIIDTMYQGYGVTFSCVTASRSFAFTSCTSGHVFANFSASSGSNIVTPLVGLQPFDVRYGVVQATFATPRTWVTIDVTPLMLPEHLGTVTAKPWLAAYDSKDQWIATAAYPVQYPQAGWDQTRTLSINAGSAKIKYVRFSSEYFSGTPLVYGKFDNLFVNGDPLTIVEKPERPPILRPVF